MNKNDERFSGGREYERTPKKMKKKSIEADRGHTFLHDWTPSLLTTAFIPDELGNVDDTTFAEFLKKSILDIDDNEKMRLCEKDTLQNHPINLYS